MFEAIDNLPKPDKHATGQHKDINLLPKSSHLSKEDKAKIKHLKKDAHLSYQKKVHSPAYSAESAPPIARATKQRKKKAGQQLFFTKIFNIFKPKLSKGKQKTSVILSSKKISGPKAAKEHNKTAHDLHFSWQDTIEKDKKPANGHAAAAEQKLKKVQEGEGKDKDKRIEFTTVKEPNISGQKPEDAMDVNLLPKRKHFLTDKQMILSYIFIVIIGFLIIISPYVYYQSKASQYQKDISALEKDNSQISQKAEQLQNKIENYGDLSTKMDKVLVLFNNHIYWSKFFPTLEKYTVQNIYFTALGADEEYNISLQGKALSLKDVAEQLVVFNNNFDYQNVALNNININKDDQTNNISSVEAGFTFTLDKNILYPDQNN